MTFESCFEMLTAAPTLCPDMRDGHNHRRDRMEGLEISCPWIFNVRFALHALVSLFSVCVCVIWDQNLYQQSVDVLTRRGTTVHCMFVCVWFQVSESCIWTLDSDF